MLGKHWEVLDEVLSIEPFSDWHFAYNLGFFHNILSSLETFFSVLPMLQKMTLQFSHGEFPLRELFGKTMSILFRCVWEESFVHSMHLFVGSIVKLNLNVA